MNPEAEPNSTPINIEQQFDALAPYMISNLQQRRQLLRQLIKHRALISAHYGEQRSFLTTVLELPANEERLLIDANPSATLMHQVTSASRLLCVTQLEQVRIQFILRELQLQHSSQGSMLSAPLPAEILYLQRRESYRLQVPLSHHTSVQLSRPAHSPEPLALSGRLLNISIGGLGLLLPATAAEIAPDERIEVRLSLPAQGLIDATMRVRYLHVSGQHGDSVHYQVGLAFEELEQKQENQIQRYIFHTERERKALEQARS